MNLLKYKKKDNNFYKINHWFKSITVLDCDENTVNKLDYDENQIRVSSYSSLKKEKYIEAENKIYRESVCEWIFKGKKYRKTDKNIQKTGEMFADKDGVKYVVHNNKVWKFIDYHSDRAILEDIYSKSDYKYTSYKNCFNIVEV